MKTVYQKEKILSFLQSLLFSGTSTQARTKAGHAMLVALFMIIIIVKKVIAMTLLETCAAEHPVHVFVCASLGLIPGGMQQIQGISALIPN